MIFFKQKKGAAWPKISEKCSKTIKDGKKEGCIFFFFSSLFLSPLASVMPKEPKCHGNKCSLKKSLKTNEHLKRYHDPEPVKFDSVWDGQIITVKRTGQLGDYYCIHPDCSSSTPLRSSCITHHSTCKWIHRQYNGVRIEGKALSTSSAKSPLDPVKEGSVVSIFVQPDQQAGKAFNCFQIKNPRYKLLTIVLFV